MSNLSINPASVVVNLCPDCGALGYRNLNHGLRSRCSNCDGRGWVAIICDDFTVVRRPDLSPFTWQLRNNKNSLRWTIDRMPMRAASCNCGRAGCEHIQRLEAMRAAVQK